MKHFKTSIIAIFIIMSFAFTACSSNQSGESANLPDHSDQSDMTNNADQDNDNKEDEVQDIFCDGLTQQTPNPNYRPIWLGFEMIATSTEGQGFIDEETQVSIFDPGEELVAHYLAYQQTKARICISGTDPETDFDSLIYISMEITGEKKMDLGLKDSKIQCNNILS